jgi:hypothetical protein
MKHIADKFVTQVHVTNCTLALILKLNYLESIIKVITLFY